MVRGEEKRRGEVRREEKRRGAVRREEKRRAERRAPLHRLADAHGGEFSADHRDELVGVHDVIHQMEGTRLGRCVRTQPEERTAQRSTRTQGTVRIRGQ